MMASYTNFVTNLVNNYYNVVDGQLSVGGMLITDIVNRFGTPLFVYSPYIFLKKLCLLRNALPDFDIHYSVKANPTPAIISQFINENCGLEIASSGELALALRCGCPPSNILYSGIGKTDTELMAAINAGVSRIHLESLEEIDRLSFIAQNVNSHFHVSIRVNPCLDIPGSGRGYGGNGPSPFGIDEEILPFAVEKVLGAKGLIFSGLMNYIGTQILDYKILLQISDHTISLASEIAKYSGKPLETLNFGGGLGVPYYETEKELQIEELGKQLIQKINETRTIKGLEHTKFIIEPGRYLVAEGGLYVAQVIGRKTSRGTNYIIINGGMNHHLLASGNLGQVIKRNFPVALANQMEKEASIPYNIAGPLCTPLDTLIRNVLFPPVEVGDIVVFFQSGAYVRSLSPLNFNSHPEPMEVTVESDVPPTIVRFRGKDTDGFRYTIMDKNQRLLYQIN